MKRAEEQDRGDTERKSSIGQEQNRTEEDKQKQDKIKERDCAHEEHFDSEVDSCIPDQGKEVCDSDVSTIMIVEGQVQKIRTVCLIEMSKSNKIRTINRTIRKTTSRGRSSSIVRQ